MEILYFSARMELRERKLIKTSFCYFLYFHIKYELCQWSLHLEKLDLGHGTRECVNVKGMEMRRF